MSNPRDFQIFKEIFQIVSNSSGARKSYKQSYFWKTSHLLEIHDCLGARNLTRMELLLNSHSPVGWVLNSWMYQPIHLLVDSWTQEFSFWVQLGRQKVLENIDVIHLATCYWRNIGRNISVERNDNIIKYQFTPSYWNILNHLYKKPHESSITLINQQYQLETVKLPQTVYYLERHCLNKD